MTVRMRHINLYQAEFRPARVVFRASQMLTALGLLLLGMLAVHGWGVWQSRELTAHVHQVRQQTETLEARLATLVRPAAPAVPDAALTAEIQRLESQLAALTRLEQALRSGALGSTRGWSAHFEALARVHVPGLWLTGVHLEGGSPDLTLRGRCLDGHAPARYIALLRREPQFAGLAFASLEITAPETKAESADPMSPALAAPMPAGTLEFILSGRSRSASTSPDRDTPRP